MQIVKSLIVPLDGKQAFNDLRRGVPNLGPLFIIANLARIIAFGKGYSVELCGDLYVANTGSLATSS